VRILNPLLLLTGLFLCALRGQCGAAEIQVISRVPISNAALNF
jgi:hypothetical protein